MGVLRHDAPAKRTLAHQGKGDDTSRRRLCAGMDYERDDWRNIMSKQFTVTLPWPDRKLSPNHRGNWRTKETARKTAIDMGFCAALDAKGNSHGSCVIRLRDQLKMTLTFHPPDKRRRDLDNIESSMKYYSDGVFALLAIDDSAVVESTKRWGDVKPGGEVVMTLEAMDE